MAEKAFGATLGIGDGNLASSPTYTTIANVKRIGDFEIESLMADITHHSSTGGYREKMPNGIFEVGDVELTISYRPGQATHANSSGGLTHALLNQTELAYKITMADSSSTNWSFDAYVAKTGTVIDTGEEELQQNITLTVTGQPVLA